ncbi:hypothetical protein NPIL_386031, partial [Nephila pilipes]
QPFKLGKTAPKPVQLWNYICLENGLLKTEYLVSCIECEQSELIFVCQMLRLIVEFFN